MQLVLLDVSAETQLLAGSCLYSLLQNLYLTLLVISTEAAYCTALCWTVGHSKSGCVLLLYCCTLCGKSGTHLCSAAILGPGLLFLGTLMHTNHEYRMSGERQPTDSYSRYEIQMLIHSSRVKKRHPGTSTIPSATPGPEVAIPVPLIVFPFFNLVAFFLSFTFPFPCFSLTCCISIFPPYPPFPPSSSWFCLVSFLWPPGDHGDLFVPLATCAL